MIDQIKLLANSTSYVNATTLITLYVPESHSL